MDTVARLLADEELIQLQEAVEHVNTLLWNGRYGDAQQYLEEQGYSDGMQRHVVKQCAAAIADGNRLGLGRYAR